MGTTLTPAQRARLPKSDFACPSRAPGAGSYPIDKPTRVASAKGYYRRRYTAKCKGGKPRKVCYTRRRPTRTRIFKRTCTKYRAKRGR